MILTARVRRPALLAAVLLVHSPAVQADTLSAVLRGSYIESISSGGDVVDAHDLTAGTSSGFAAFTQQAGYGINSADDRNLATYFARNGGSDEWTIDLVRWRDTNGSAHDFFVFEVGPGDSILVAPLLPTGLYGVEVPITGWSNTGYQPSTGHNQGQSVHGLAFGITDLRSNDGTFLTTADEILGIRIRSATIDGAAFLAHVVDADAHQSGDGGVTVVGRAAVGQPLELVFDGPWASETGVAPNPFLDRRLEVTFHGPTGEHIRVPGFFDADGKGGTTGTVWKARFSPPHPGQWLATTRFREGSEIAVRLGDPGTPGLLEGVTAQFAVAPLDAAAPGFHGRGHLTYVGEHYQQFTDGSWFVKGGVNSPENLLAYRGFDAVGRSGGGLDPLHSYGPHVGDWQPGDPLFTSDAHEYDSKAIIGAINYLGSMDVNSMFMIVMNLGGDGWDVHPFLGDQPTVFDKTHYDTGRLHQWNVVFEHAARRGVALHIALAETESANETWLDNGTLGTERKLFFREMVARFAHHPAIKWTLSEENDYSIATLREFADYLRRLDPYDHIVTFHNFPNDLSDYNQVLGEPDFSATALQFYPNQIGDQIELLRSASDLAGHRWVVQADENQPWQTGLTDTNAASLRRRALYDALFSGGGIEWYFGYHPLPLGGDLRLEDFRTREEMWGLMSDAVGFFEEHLPFHEMQPDDGLLSGESANYGGGEVFVKPGEVYAVYLPDASPAGVLDMTGTGGVFTRRWWDPRTGEFAGAAEIVSAGQAVPLGTPPSSPGLDWVALVQRFDEAGSGSAY